MTDIFNKIRLFLLSAALMVLASTGHVEPLNKDTLTDKTVALHGVEVVATHKSLATVQAFYWKYFVTLRRAYRRVNLYL